MKNTFIRIAALSATLSLFTACAPESAPTPTTSINVTNMQGGKSDISGIWKEKCFTSSNSTGSTSPDIITTHIYTESTLTAIETSYASTNGTCTGTAVESGRGSATLTLGSEVTATGGWTDSVRAVSAPIAQDGVSTLPSTPVGTKLLLSNMTVSGSFAPSSSSTGSLILAIDASVTNNLVAHEVYNNGSGVFLADSRRFIKQ